MVPGQEANDDPLKDNGMFSVLIRIASMRRFV